MIPVAYTSPYTDKTFYVGETIHNGQEVWFAVADGLQPTEGIIFPDRREVRAWLIDNGFQIKA